MARKLPQLQRVVDAPLLFSIAYGEIASSIYFALGIIALYALGLTPFLLLAVGLLFLLVSMSYAEGTAAVRETGGAATLVRVAYNDLFGFVTGWALFLDYLIVIALSALFLPHYVAGAFFTQVHRPWDVVSGCGAIAAIGVFRLFHRTRIHRWAVAVALVDLGTQVLLVVLGFSLLFSADALTRGTSLGSSPSWHSIAFALPLAMLAYTGLETVANFAEEVRSPGRDLPRSVFSAVGLVVVRALRVPVRRRDGARLDVAALAPDGDRVAAARARAGRRRLAAAGLRRVVRRADPADGGDDVDVGVRPARVLARRAWPAAAEVRAAA
jgi:APA family basic amino acid/polyamine antiporter